MTDISLPRPQRLDLPRRFLELIPGVALLAVIGYLGKLIEQTIAAYGKAHALHLPNIEYVLWAILIGLAIANTVGVPRIFRAGIATYEFWLKAGIVFLGVRFLIGDVLRLGGVSAIIAAKGAIAAEDEDASYAIAAILALGALALFLFPVIGHALGMGDHAFGLWAGLGVDNTAEAAATGALYSDAAGKYAVLAKTTRNATIGFVVLGYAIYWANRGRAQQIGNKAAFLWQKFPKFILGFLFISLIATLGAFSKEQVSSLANLSRWAFLLTFAGVGLMTDFREMRKQGIRPFIVGALGEIAIAALTLGLVLGADAVFAL